MGVHSDVHVCVQGDAPLTVDQRSQLIDLCRAHDLLSGECALGVPEPIKPRGLREWLQQRVLSRELGPKFSASGLQPYGGLQAQRGVRIVARQPVGPWLVDAVRAHSGTDFIVGCGGPLWNGKPVDGGFVYLASHTAVPVKIINAYRERSRFEPGDGVIGSFFDVLSISAKHDLDGRKVAASAWIAAVKKTLGLKVTCRASQW